MTPIPSRQMNVGSVKSLFDELIDRHAEAYLAAQPELKEFSKFEKSGTINNYIGMVWMNDYEKPSTNALKIRGSQSLANNRLVELDLSSVQAEQAFFPGQIVAFSADPFLKEQLVVRRFFDPIKIAPALKKINTIDKINLVIASGPYMKPEQEDWTLFDNLLESAKSHNATHIVLIGPFVDMENKVIRSNYESSWRLVFDKLAEALHDHECHVYIVPSGRDILASSLQGDYFYPSSGLKFRLNLKDGLKLKCSIESVTDPAQIDLGGVYLDVTAADVLFQAKNCMSTINRPRGNLQYQFMPVFKHIISHGIYPIYPPPLESAIDFPKLHKFLTPDRLGSHIIVLPNKMDIPAVLDMDGRLLVNVKKCSVTKKLIMIEIPVTESTEDAPVDSLLYTNYTHRMIDLIHESSQAESQTSKLESSNASMSVDSKGDSLSQDQDAENHSMEMEATVQQEQQQ